MAWAASPIRTARPELSRQRAGATQRSCRRMAAGVVAPISASASAPNRAARARATRWAVASSQAETFANSPLARCARYQFDSPDAVRPDHEVARQRVRRLDPPGAADHRGRDRGVQGLEEVGARDQVRAPVLDHVQGAPRAVGELEPVDQPRVRAHGIADADAVERGHHVGPHGEPGSGRRAIGRLFVQRHGPALGVQRRREGEAGDAAAYYRNSAHMEKLL